MKLSENRNVPSILRRIFVSVAAPFAVAFLFAACSPSSNDAQSTSVINVVDAIPQPLHFAEGKIPESTPGGACNFDLIAGSDRDLASIEIDSTRTAQYTGWAAVSANEGVLSERVTLALVGTKNYTMVPNADVRKDVAAYFKVPALENAGFEANASVADVVPGNYLLKVYMLAGGKFIECGNFKKVSIK
ncbi:MAG: hypothetical protein H7293_19350 [Candidatus Saccharibacteria bacterium]|nr:hypothetical protein [Rhodoferax sp.]